MPSLKGMSKQGIAGSLPVFRFLRGKSRRIDEIDDCGMAVFAFAIPAGKFKGWHTVSIEPLLLERRPDRLES